MLWKEVCTEGDDVEEDVSTYRLTVKTSGHYANRN